MTSELILAIIWLYGHHLLTLVWAALVLVGAATLTTWMLARGK